MRKVRQIKKLSTQIANSQNPPSDDPILFDQEPLDRCVSSVNKESDMDQNYGIDNPSEIDYNYNCDQGNVYAYQFSIFRLRMII